MPDLSYQPTSVCANGQVEIYKVRSQTIRLTISNTDVGDITGAKLWMSVKLELDDTDANAVIEKKNEAAGGPAGDTEAAVTDVTNRVVEFYIDPADTEDLESGDYIWDAVIELSGGSRLQLIPPTRFTISQPVTVTTVAP